MMIVRVRPDTPAPVRRRRWAWLYLIAAVLLPMVTSSVYYIIASDFYLSMRGIDPDNPPAEPIWSVLGQLARNVVVAGALAVLARWLRVSGVADALRLGVLVWFGFQAMAVAGSVLHEQYPPGLYLLHIGDALQATLVMALLVGLAQKERRS